MYTITTKLVSKVFLTWFKGLNALLCNTLEKVGKTIFTSFVVIVHIVFYCCINSSKKWQEWKQLQEELIKMESCHPWHLSGHQTRDGGRQQQHFPKDLDSLIILEDPGRIIEVSVQHVQHWGRKKYNT